MGFTEEPENEHINVLLNTTVIPELQSLFLYINSNKIIPANFWVDILQHFFFKQIKIQVKEMLPIVTMILLNI